MPEKQFQVRWEIDVWDETPTGAVYRAARYAQQAAFRSVYEVVEMSGNEPVGEPTTVDLEEVLSQAEAQ